MEAVSGKFFLNKFFLKKIQYKKKILQSLRQVIAAMEAVSGKKK